MPDTGVYVIRESDRAILYFNECAHSVSSRAALGTPCYQVWSGSCGCCPLSGIESRRENRTVSYNAAYGGIVDLTAVRITWQDNTPAFVITVTPRRETTSSTYRKILCADLLHDRCDVLKSDPEGWQPSGEHLSVQLAAFASSGAIHPEDVPRFTAFTSLSSLRTPPPPGREALTLIYRRLAGASYRWNLMELIPDTASGGRSAILCVKDVHDVFQEGLERECLTIRAQEQAQLQALEDRAQIIGSLSSLFFSTYYMDLEHDTFRAVTQLRRITDVLGEEVNCTSALQIYAHHFIHPDDRESYLKIMNVQNLRQSLRWWTPCVAVEYRMLPEPLLGGSSKTSWVRATAILALTGPDDMPKTAVYVAQDVTDNHHKNDSV